MPSLSSTIRDTQGRLEAAHAVGPSEAKQLVKHVLGLDDVALVMGGDAPFPAGHLPLLESLVERRMGGQPLAQILGYAWFYGRKWKVTADTLIPRPDTETLVHEVLTRLPEKEMRFCEVGVGTGCIMGTLLEERIGWQGLGVDISPAALAVAEENLAALGASGRWELRHGDGLEGIAERFNLIISNPPYITDAEWEMLEGEVKDFEPRLALTGGVPNGDGLVFYRRLAQWGITNLLPGGWLCVEVGWQQAEAVRELLNEQNATNNTTTGAIWQEISITKDLGGRERVVCARRC